MAGPASDHNVDHDVANERTAVHDDLVVTRTPDVSRARGGVSLWGILSGVLVAIGAFVILAALIGSILVGSEVVEGTFATMDLSTGVTVAGVVLLVVQFLSYLWGGYTAGRMARGAGALNGLLVAVFAILLVAILGAIAGIFAGDVQSVDPAQVQQQLPLPLGRVRDIGTITGFGLLVAMLLGGLLGGAMGARWHTKLENREIAEHTA